ncbi:MAG TPA: COQ9 family protein [Micropepsaceae bacterium]|jgi:ubiquinone biosynthesis protein COQ9|nr:COQ9 family protein [Micropepsaceae bacterium]
MSDVIRDRVLAEALGEIRETGVSDATLARAAEKAGVSKRELADSFPQGPVSLVEAFSHWADRRMEEILAASGKERMRDRIAGAVKARIEAVAPHKDTVRRMMAFLALPRHAALAAKLTMQSVDAMWRAAGDRSSDFSYYTKRATLAGVYASTFAFWLTDASDGHAATWTFLDNRIDNVMSIEKLKGAAKNALGKLPDPLKIFSNFRGRQPR